MAVLVKHQQLQAQVLLMLVAAAVVAIPLPVLVVLAVVALAELVIPHLKLQVVLQTQVEVAAGLVVLLLDFHLARAAAV
jgi:hypothetical protein